MTYMPLSTLENILHQDKQTFDENYIVELNNGELVTLGTLMTFWIEGHRKIKSALDIIKETKEKVERKSETKSEVSSEQEVEAVCSPTVSKTKRTRRNNKNKTEKV